MECANPVGDRKIVRYQYDGCVDVSPTQGADCLDSVESAGALAQDEHLVAAGMTHQSPSASIRAPRRATRAGRAARLRLAVRRSGRSAAWRQRIDEHRHPEVACPEN